MEKHRWLVIIVVILAVAAVLLTKSLIKQDQTDLPGRDSDNTAVIFMTEQFTEAYARAREEGRITILAITEKPFCACFGDKEIRSGLTLNAYNTQLIAILEQVQNRYPDQCKIILIDRNGLGAAELNQLIELRQQLGVEDTPVLLMIDPSNKVLYQNENNITINEIYAVLD